MKARNYKWESVNLFITGEKNKDDLKQRKDPIQKEVSFVYIAVQIQDIFTFVQQNVSK